MTKCGTIYSPNRREGLTGGRKGQMAVSTFTQWPLPRPAQIYGLYRDIQASGDDGTTWEVTGSAPDNALDIAASTVSPDIL